MPALADVERLLERVFERTTARVFRARLRVVQVERRVERSMERARVTGGGRTAVPSRYRVHLNPADLASLAADMGGAEALAARLADAALAFAKVHAYQLPGRPVVAVVSDARVQRGAVEVDAVAGRDRSSGFAMDPGGSPAASPLDAPPGPQVEPAADQGTPADRTATPPRGVRTDAQAAYIRPASGLATAVVRVVGRDGRERTADVGGSALTLGRARENALVLDDPRVSRQHGRLVVRRGTLVYTDLGSTNGTRVNGIRVDECVLAMGDRVVLGDTVLVVEQLPA